jgi:predicted dehydrogenase
MRFALLGDHPDGLDMARALVESGRHELAAYSGSPVGAEYLRRWNVPTRPVGDLEEVLADPGVEAVVVAGSPADRPAQLRRALQSERYVLCVHPADQNPDTAYEAAMLQADTKQLLLPLLPEALHPGIQRLAELARGDVRLVELERWGPEAVLLEHDTPGHRPAVPGWDVLRLVGGEIAEVVAYAAPDEMAPEEALLLAGRFEGGGVFQASFVPNHPEPRWRLAVLTGYDRLELTFAQGWPGPARLTRRDESGAPCEETWEAWDPWPAVVEAFEAAALARYPVRRQLQAPARDQREAVTAAGTGGPLVPARGGTSGPLVPAEPAALLLTWQDEVRCLELDDAARRSVERRRASTLEYQEATEEAGFKGTMTLVGCSLLWGSLVLLIASRWVPWLGWAILPVFALFLALQLLRWAVPPRPGAEEQGAAARRGLTPPEGTTSEVPR